MYSEDRRLASIIKGAKYRENRLPCYFCNFEYNHIIAITISSFCHSIVITSKGIREFGKKGYNHSEIAEYFICENCWHVWKMVTIFHKGETALAMDKVSMKELGEIFGEESKEFIKEDYVELLAVHDI
ncbi:MAG: hypothetical protein KatS3mg003_0733 [Candidatus Nitrosocaldaceae archaeon]|nr:MAG: hypothetical protein KatS3mg003_0733 [Candidatus Nitrosocaldaceae archaeon]